jgi:hypothetical protein
MSLRLYITKSVPLAYGNVKKEVRIFVTIFARLGFAIFYLLLQALKSWQLFP